MFNPFLKTSKEKLPRTPNKHKRKESYQDKRKNSKSLSDNPKSASKKKSVRDENLKSLNSKEKNPIIFPKNMKDYLKKKNKIKMMSPDRWGLLGGPVNQKNIKTFDERLEKVSKSKGHLKLKGILRWDDLSFGNKDSIFEKEGNIIKKKLNDKKMLKEIQKYRKGKMKSKNKNRKKLRKRSDKENTSDSENSLRQDMFGNTILKGGNNHRVSFSSYGDMKIVQNWKTYNLINSIRPDRTNKNIPKVKCLIF